MNGHAESYTDVAIQLPVRTSDLNVVYRDEKLSSPLERTYYKLLKRTVDVLVSTFAIVFILSWMTPLAAIIIKLNSRGPVFFIQKRHMKNGQVFNCIKFRLLFLCKTIVCSH